MNKFFIFMLGIFMASSCGNNAGSGGNKTAATGNNAGSTVGANTANSNETGGNVANVKVLLTTSEGDVLLLLYDDTPKHRDNFVKLVESGYYDGVIFHRVIENFMIQTGDPNSKNPTPEGTYGSGGPDYRIPAEFAANRYHKKGALAAARTNNPAKESSGSQFYIVQGKTVTAEYLQELGDGKKIKYSDEAVKDYTTAGGTPFLDNDYTVFGEVIEGLDIVDAIAKTKTGRNDRPVKDIFIQKAKIVK